MTDDEAPGREILMPFLPVQSKGGPHEDNAYTAGWEMGMLWHRLETACMIGIPSEGSLAIRRDNREQADLIAMHFGYVAEFHDYDDDWTTVTFTAGTEVDG